MSERASFADHFSGHAQTYARARPDYPCELFAWLAGQCARRALAWDVGCGNGQASVALAAHFAKVHASDPSATQIAQARVHPRVRYAVEAGEDCTLTDASVDCISVAQALHWFDHPRFYTQVRRVARPGALFAAFGYERSRVSPTIDAVFAHLYSDLLGAYWPPERAHVEARYRSLPFPFTEITPPAFELHAAWTLTQYLDYLRSWSATQRYLQAHGEDPVTLLAADFARAWGEPSSPRTVRWPMILRVGRV